MDSKTLCLVNNRPITLRIFCRNTPDFYLIIIPRLAPRRFIVESRNKKKDLPGACHCINKESNRKQTDSVASNMIDYIFQFIFS